MYRARHWPPDRPPAAPEGLAGAFRELNEALRAAERGELRWEDVDLECGALHVRGTLTRLAGQGLVRTSPKNRSSG